MNKRSGPLSEEAKSPTDLWHDIAALRKQMDDMGALLARIARIEVARFAPGDEQLQMLIDGLTADRDMLRDELRKARAVVSRQANELTILTGLNVGLRNEIGTLERQLREARDALEAAVAPAVQHAAPGAVLEPVPPPLPSRLSLSMDKLRGTGIHDLEEGTNSSFAWFSPEVCLDLSGLVAHLSSITFDLVSVRPGVDEAPPLAQLNDAMCTAEFQLGSNGSSQLRIGLNGGAGTGEALVLKLLFERHSSVPGDARQLTVACSAMHLAG